MDYERIKMYVRMFDPDILAVQEVDDSKSPACETLMTQVPILEGWIDAASSQPEPFILLGDFNRRLNRPDDRVWVEIDDLEPPNSDLTTVTADMPVGCRDNEYADFVDHIVLDKRAVQWVDFSSFRQVPFRQQDKAQWDYISDHCPLVVELWIP